MARDLETRRGDASAVLVIRRFKDEDTGTLWALSALPVVGATADPRVPFPIPPTAVPPADYPDLIDVRGTYLLSGGDFLVADLDGHVVAAGGIMPYPAGHAELLRIRVHPAMRRRGIGRTLVEALETRAAEMGVREVRLTTATNQPEAMSFFRSLGYTQTGRERQVGWSWTLVHYAKSLA